ncbi:MAG: hypothetical protein ACT4N8_06025 [Sphingosinicella sp.]|uniref:hypothetical protein n=1 Tax=Sphingosinicella sp. TaxID=1917971 RepID=UPI0040381056
MVHTHIRAMAFSIHVRVSVPLGLKPPRFTAPRRKRSGGDEGEAMPAKPDRPLPLLGGAAAALEFDD